MLQLLLLLLLLYSVVKFDEEGKKVFFKLWQAQVCARGYFIVDDVLRVWNNSIPFARFFFSWFFLRIEAAFGECACLYGKEWVWWLFLACRKMFDSLLPINLLRFHLVFEYITKLCTSGKRERDRVFYRPSLSSIFGNLARVAATNGNGKKLI